MEPFLDVVRALGRTLWRWGLVIWVCRVPVASTLAGGFLLALAPQARDFFADLGIAWWEWAIFFGLVFAWAWIVHSGARRALQHDDWVPEAHAPGGLSDERRKELQVEFYWPALIIPRALGLLVFFFIGWGVCQTRRNLQDASALPMAHGAVTVTLWLLIATIVVMVVFVALTWQWRTIQRRWPAVARFSTAPNQVLLIGSLPVLAGLWQSRGVPNASGQQLARANRLLLAARVLILLALLVTLVDPHLVAAWVPRVFFAPVLFAGVVLLLGEFAAWSHRLRTPLLLIVAGFAAASLYFVDRFHDVHWIATRESSTPRQITFETAVKRWMRANDCDPAAGRECPRPILIAGAGGASRAAFLTASVVGGLMDLDRAQFGNVRNRIFAMSTVSGSSVGAVVVRAAMADAVERGRPHDPPCVTGGTRAWFGCIASSYGMKGTFDPKTSWRDCFQAIIAGDFLSPVMVGLAYRDTFPLGNPFNGTAWWADRAQLLEQGFERRYHRMTTNKRARTCRDLPAKGPG